RSGSPSARLTTCSSQTFSAIVRAMCDASSRLDGCRGVLAAVRRSPRRPARKSSPRCPHVRAGGFAFQIARRQYQAMDNSSPSSGVGVLDKTMSVLDALESGPASLAQLVRITGLARPTAHRLAVALERHRMVTRDSQGRFVLGPRLNELSIATGEDRLLAIATPVLAQLRDLTGESAQLYRRQGDVRVCVAAAERASGLRD